MKQKYQFGSKYYDRQHTRLEKELIARGWKPADWWVMVGDTPDGKKVNRKRMDYIFDNAQYQLGIQHIENVAVACGVGVLTVIDWIRLDRNPEKMTRKQFNLYKMRIVDIDNADRVRWFLAMFARKKLPVLYVLEKILGDGNFKKENDYINKSDYVYHNYIKKGIYDPSKAKKKDAPK